MTLHPSTATELLLMQERDAALARAEEAERHLAESITHAELTAARSAMNATRARAERAEVDLATLTHELAESARRGIAAKEERDHALRELGAQIARTEQERVLRVAAEQHCARLSRELDQVSDEFRDTVQVAESIVAAPAAQDAKLETGLIEALGLINALVRRHRATRACLGGVVPETPLTQDELVKLAELRGLVPS